jgi:HPr kinase/phosphorylase
MTDHMDGATIQAVLVKVNRVGVLLQGPAGSGKSLAALRLMDRGHRLVADDAVAVSVGPDGELIGRPIEADVRIEIRGLGVFRARSLFEEGTAESACINFVVEIDEYSPEADSGRVTPQVSETQILGRKLPCVRVPLPRGADCALIVELLAGRFARSGTVTDE